MKWSGDTRTADDLLKGVDLEGRRALVTGASAGMGVEIAGALARSGMEVIGTARNVRRARDDTTSMSAQLTSGSLQYIELDLSSLSSVRSCADALRGSEKPFDLVIANAGLMAGPMQVTADGFEAQFAINYLGHFELINSITDLIRDGGRIVMVSSAGHRNADVDIEDPNFERSSYNEYIAYGRSKTAMILFAVEFDRRSRSRGVRATAVHPGAVMTRTVERMIEGLGAGKDAAVARFEWKTGPQGAAGAIWAGAVAPAEVVAAGYVEECAVAEINDDPNVQTGVRSYALDGDHAAALWFKTEQLLGV